MKIILAPHIDDELIGCYSILDDVDEVIYFFDYKYEHKDRVHEALNLKKLYNYKITFSDVYKIKERDFSEDVLYVPSSKDHHEHHKLINKISYELNAKEVNYYSIDMNRKPKLVSNYNRKKELLYLMYPSQKKLFDTDDKYFLFEDIHRNDFEIYETFNVNDFSFEIEITDLSNKEASYIIGAIILNTRKCNDIIQVVNEVKKFVKDEKCIIKHKNKIVKVN